MMKHTLLALLLLSTVACSKLVPQDGAGNLDNAPVSAKGLDGSWVSRCHTDANWSGGEVTTSTTFSSGLALLEVKVWSEGSDCSELLYTAELTEAYELRSSSSVNAAFEIDLTLLSAQVTPQNQTAADELNQVSFKGISSWGGGQTQSFSDLADSGWSVNHYDVVVIQPSYLFWGDSSTGDGSTPENRPTAIDSTNYQMRQ